MFGITTLAVVSFSLGQSDLPSHMMAALFWVILFFSAIAGLAQVFIREEETGTALALKLSSPAEPIYVGKLLFNFCLLVVMTAIITPLFFIFTDAGAADYVGFILVLLLGIIGLCGATTLVAAIIARAPVKGALFAVLSFPILIPLLLALVKATQKLFDGAVMGTVLMELQFLLAYAVVMITGSVLLFRFVWQE
jgi:heme exporter protein B